MGKQKQKLSVVEGSSIDVHKAYSGKKFTQHDLESFPNPTYPQTQYIDSHYRDTPIILQIGSAGTGKTAVAMYCSLSDVFDKSTPYDKIAIFRSAVQARDIGFLPGDQTEKNEAYEAPYSALCDEFLKFKTNNYENLKSVGLIEFHNTSFLRGTTFNDTILIVDECQNMTYEELSTIMTRVGVRSKIIFCGDFGKQIDLHKRNDVCGVERFMKVIERMDSSSTDVVRYTPNDIVRSGIVKEFLIAEEECER
ncbi:MAG: PhoH family protein [Nitrosopumilaceae archaeon]|nr:PhoH family protein [Nitrosopumilaceae archaeon]